MPYITVGTENSAPIEIYYEDYGSGDPIILIHGWPLNGASWEKQTQALLEAGYRVITYDRRGFGQSSKPSEGYNYDTFADDLHQVITELQLSKVSLVGFSMGSGEVTRYLGKYGSEKIDKAVLIGVIPPYLVKTEDNPTGIDKKILEDIKAQVMADRPAYTKEFFKKFYNAEELIGKRISEEVHHHSWGVAMNASPLAAWKCVDTWMEDFRKDLDAIDVPTLVLHGTKDQILPIDNTARPLRQILRKANYVEIPDAPHGLLWTHATEVNRELTKFFGPSVRAESRPVVTEPHASLQ